MVVGAYYQRKGPYMSAITPPCTVFTVGHSNIAAETLLTILQRQQVRVLVDIRSAPFSAYTPQFNREVFSQFAIAHGLDYRYAGEALGGRPTDPTCYFNGELPDAKANYLELVDYAAVARRDWYLRGIDRLVMLAQAQPTVIMCSEGDPHKCHRHHLIARTLLGRGVVVHHLREQAAQDVVLLPGEQMDFPQQLKLF